VLEPRFKTLETSLAFSNYSLLCPTFHTLGCQPQSGLKGLIFFEIQEAISQSPPLPICWYSLIAILSYCQSETCVSLSAVCICFNNRYRM